MSQHATLIFCFMLAAVGCGSNKATSSNPGTGAADGSSQASGGASSGGESSQSGGNDANSGGAVVTGGAAATGGALTTGGASATGGSASDCPPECLVANQCVAKCGDTAQNNGCCSCPSGTINVFSCGDSQQGVSCDARDVLCKAVPPTCEDGMAPSVSDTCWGPCVPIDWCLCSGPEYCPNENIYTCHNSAGRCGPYVN